MRARSVRSDRSRPYDFEKYAVGGSERAARYSGIRIERVRLIVYTASGLFAGIAGFLFLTRTGYISYASGGNLLLTTIAAVVVGGVSLAAGSGGTKQVLAGALFFAVLGNFMKLLCQKDAEPTTRDSDGSHAGRWLFMSWPSYGDGALRRCPPQG
jgi:ribose/xylose/arabinose/galactoside ABC-type transport system permease subunit